MFNANVRGVLDRYVVGDYQLSEEGAQFIIDANARLPEEYFAHLEFPVSPFWFDYFSSKINVLLPLKFGKLLDVCCGTGTLCLNLMQRELFEECVAIDNSSVAISRLAERLQQSGIRNVRPLKEDVGRTTFANDSFDVIAGNSFLHHLPDNRSFLIEMHRILRPGATICLTGEPSVGANVLENAVMGPPLAVLRALHIKRRPPADAQSITDIWVYEAKKVRRLMEDCGFSEVKIVPFGFLVPLLNGPSAYVRGLLSMRTMQPDAYWKYLGAIDKHAFGWLPPNWHSHFVIAGRKKEAPS